MPEDTNDIDWAAREEELLALKKDDLVARATEAGIDASGNKGDIVARLIGAEQDAAAGDDITIDSDDVEDVTPDDDADDAADEATEDAEDDADEDLAIGDAMADVAADLAAESEEAVKAAADHERAHSMAVPATPGTVAEVETKRLVKPTKPAEAWDALKASIQSDLEGQVTDLFEDAADATIFAAEFSEKLAKYKYKAATARDTFQKRQYEKNLQHLEAQVETEAARVKIKLVKDGDDLLMRILTVTIKTVAGAALGALI